MHHSVSIVRVAPDFTHTRRLKLEFLAEKGRKKLMLLINESFDAILNVHMTTVTRNCR